MRNWLLICKMLLRTYHNAFSSKLKKDPVIGLIPLIVTILAIAGPWYFYVQIYDALSAYSKAQALQGFIYQISGNVFLSIFFIIFISTLIFLQTGIGDRDLVKILAATPVTRRDIIIGSLTPGIAVLTTLMIIVMLPTTLAMCSLLRFSLPQKIAVALAMLLLIVTAVLLGLALSRIVRETSNYIFGGRSKNIISVLNTIVIIILIFLMVKVAIFSTVEKTAYYAQLLPPVWMQKLLVATYNCSVYGIASSAAMVMGYFGLSILLALLSFSMFRTKEIKGHQFKILTVLPFSAIQLINVFVLELKQIARDFELLLYMLLIITMFVGSGWLIVSSDLLTKVIPFYAQMLSYGFIFTLSVFPLASRGRDRAFEILLLASPLRIINYVVGKVAFYIITITSLGILLTHALLQILGLKVEGNVLSQVPLYALSVALAYFIGSIFKFNHNDTVVQIIVSWIFMIILALSITGITELERLVYNSIAGHIGELLVQGSRLAAILLFIIMTYLVELGRSKYASF